MSQGTTKGVPLDTDGTLAANSDQLVATQKATKTYVDVETAARVAADSAILAGAPLILPTTDARNVIQPSAATVTPLTLRGFTAQSDPLLSLENSASSVLMSVSAAGVLTFGGDTNLYRAGADLLRSGDGLVVDLTLRVGTSATLGTVQKFGVIGYTTVDNAANVILAASATTAKPLVVQAIAAQSANLTEWQSSAGAVLSAILSGGQLAFGTNPPTAGAIRMANGSTLGVQFRDNAGTGNLRGIDATTADSISIAAGQIVANFALTTVDIATRLRINNATSFGAVTKLQINGGANSTDVIFIGLLGATDIGLVVKAASAHSGALQQWRSSAGAVMSSVDAAGRFLVPLGALATVGMGFTGDPNTGSYSPGADAQSMVCGGVAQLDLTTTTLIINEGGADFDFRIESDTDANNLFSDGGTNRVGIGTGAPDHKLHVAGRVHSTVGFTSAVVAHGNTGATETIDLDAGDTHTATMDASCIFTFSNPVASGVTKFTLFLAQGSGGQLATWPGTVLWAGGTDPTLSTGAGEIDVLTFITTDGGTTWHGFLAGADMS